MRIYRNILLCVILLLQLNYCAGQADTVNHPSRNNYPSDHTNEFFLSLGYNHCTYRFIDVGIRYYYWRNDGQTAMAFAGPCAGLEYSAPKTGNIYIPYIGWQGQLIMLGYGLRAEYIMSAKNHSLGFTPEVGLSLFEILRVTAGYRFCLQKNDVLNQTGFRFSLIAALPISLLKKDRSW